MNIYEHPSVYILCFRSLFISIDCIVLSTFSHLHICKYTTVKLCKFTLDNDDMQSSKRRASMANFILNK